MSQFTVTLSNGKTVTLHQVTNDVYGNPRYVIHFLDVAGTYEEALKLSRKIGGRKYTAKWYGGGIVFSSYNLEPTLEKLLTHDGKL